MAINPVIDFLRHFRRSAFLREGAEQTDGQLLEAFISGRDNQALAGLVQRHAPMVWGVCRRNLASHHDAEDAFQATFLVLVRKAASIRSRELPASWLYRVAHKTAVKARLIAAKRYAREKQMVAMPEPKMESHDREFGPELRALLDEELSRLPYKYRIVLVLSDLEERSRLVVAQQLRLAEGTVASRLARGRAMLAKRLVRRGVSLSATSLAAALPQQAASGAVPAALLANTIKVTTLLAAGEATAASAISVQVSTLAEGVLKTMALAKQKAAGLVLLMAALVLSGGLVSYHLLERGDRTPFPDTGVDAPNPDVDPKADVKKYGSAAGAVHYVMGTFAARRRRRPGQPEIEQFCKQMCQEQWKEPAARRSADRIPPKMAELQPWLAKSQPGDRTFALEATLDRKKREWTIIGVMEVGGPEVAFELDWKFVLRFTPSTGGYEPVSYERFGANGERVRVPSDWDAFVDPVRYGLRPVGNKAGEGGKR